MTSLEDSSIWYFICDSDPQFQSGPCSAREAKVDVLQKIEKLAHQYPVDMVICAGDLTINRNNYSYCCPLPFKHHNQSNQSNHLNGYLEHYRMPIEGNLGLILLSCPGDEDLKLTTGSFCTSKPVYKHLQERYGATYNYFDQAKKGGCYKYHHKGVTFISMGIYPSNLEWLGENLPADKMVPIIFIYHYNTDSSQPYSDWWTPNEKRAFRALTEDHNVIAIVNGHYHSSGRGIWFGIPEIRGSGRKLALVKMQDNKLIDINFI